MASKPRPALSSQKSVRAGKGSTMPGLKQDLPVAPQVPCGRCCMTGSVWLLAASSRSVSLPACASQWELNNKEAARLQECSLTDEELTLAKQAFFNTDKDGSGSIDKDELALMIKSLGQTPTKKIIDDILHETDGATPRGRSTDSNGKIEV